MEPADLEDEDDGCGSAMSECWTRGRTITFTPKVRLPVQTEQELREEEERKRQDNLRLDREEELKREEESEDKPPLGSILPPMNVSEPRKPKGGVIPP